MKIIKRGLMLAAASAVSLAFAAGTASAGISPDPYSTTSGTGSFNAYTILGRSSCSLSNVAANASGSTGAVTGFTATRCGGLLTGAQYVSSIGLSLSGGVVTANVTVRIQNILGGDCTYNGTMTGAANGSDTVTVAGSLANPTSNNGGYCSDPADADLTVTLPGATIS